MQITVLASTASAWNFGVALGALPIFAVPPTPEFGTTLDVTAGEELTFTVLADDPDGGEVTLNAVGVLSGATVDPPLPAMDTGSVSSTFSWFTTTNDVGTHTVTFTATDGLGFSTDCVLDLEVMTPPEPEPDIVISGPTEATVDEPEEFEVQLTNTGGDIPENVQVEFEITRAGGIGLDDLTLEWCAETDTEGCTNWQPSLLGASPRV